MVFFEALRSIKNCNSVVQDSSMMSRLEICLKVYLVDSQKIPENSLQQRWLPYADIRIEIFDLIS